MTFMMRLRTHDAKALDSGPRCTVRTRQDRLHGRCEMKAINPRRHDYAGSLEVWVPLLLQGILF